MKLDEIGGFNAGRRAGFAAQQRKQMGPWGVANRAQNAMRGSVPNAGGQQPQAPAAPTRQEPQLFPQQAQAPVAPVQPVQPGQAQQPAAAAAPKAPLPGQQETPLSPGAPPGQMNGGQPQGPMGTDSKGQALGVGDVVQFNDQGKTSQLKVVGKTTGGLQLASQAGKSTPVSQEAIKRMGMVKVDAQQQQSQPNAGLNAQRNARMANRARMTSGTTPAGQQGSANQKMVQLAQTFNRHVGTNLEASQLQSFLDGKETDPKATSEIADALLNLVILPANSAKRRGLEQALRVAMGPQKTAQAASEAYDYVISRARVIAENRKNAWRRS